MFCSPQAANLTTQVLFLDVLVSGLNLIEGPPNMPLQAVVLGAAAAQSSGLSIGAVIGAEPLLCGLLMAKVFGMTVGVTAMTTTALVVMLYVRSLQELVVLVWDVNMQSSPVACMLDPSCNAETLNKHVNEAAAQASLWASSPWLSSSAAPFAS